jgi:hypothetical protein
MGHLSNAVPAQAKQEQRCPHGTSAVSTFLPKHILHMKSEKNYKKSHHTIETNLKLKKKEKKN